MALTNILNVNDFITSIEVVNDHTIESTSVNLFGYSIDGNRPAKKIGYYDIHVEVNTSSFETNSNYWMYFGYFLQSGYITNLMFKNNDGTPWQNNKWHYFFGNIGCGGSSFLAPVVRFYCNYRGLKKIELGPWRGNDNYISFDLYKLTNVVISEDLSTASFDISIPYFTYFTLDPKWNGLTSTNTGYLNLVAPDYTDYKFNSYNVVSFFKGETGSIQNAQSLYDYYTEIFHPFDESEKNENMLFFNKTNETISQNEFIRENATFLGYRDEERDGYGFVCNVLANDKTIFRGQAYYPTQSTDNRQDLKSCWMGRSYSPTSEGTYRPYQEKHNEFNNFDYFTIGGYYFYISQEHDTWPKFDNSNNNLHLDDGQGNVIDITRDDFIEFPGALAKKEDVTDPKNLIKLFTCESYNVYRDENRKLKCLSVFSFEYEQLLPYLEQSRAVHLGFTKCVKIGKLSRNYVNPPIGTKYGNPLNEGEWIYLVHDAEGEGVNFNTDPMIIETLNFDFQIYKDLSGDITTDADFISIDTENKIIKFSTDIDLFNMFTISDFRNMIKFPSFINYLQGNITQVFGCYAYLSSTIYNIPMNPYMEQTDTKIVELSKIFKETYTQEPVNDYIKTIVKINGANNEITAFSKNIYMNTYPLGGGQWFECNAAGQILLFRGFNIVPKKLKNVDDNNLFSLSTWYFYYFENIDDVPIIPADEIIYFCPIETYNICLLDFDSIGITIKNFSTLYTSLNTDIDYIELERYVRYIPYEKIEDMNVLNILNLLTGFGTTYI